MWLLHGGVEMCGHVLRVKCVIVVSGVAESARASGVFNEVAMSVAAMHAFGKSATAINAFGKSVAAIHPFIGVLLTFMHSGRVLLTFKHTSVHHPLKRGW